MALNDTEITSLEGKSVDALLEGVDPKNIPNTPDGGVEESTPVAPANAQANPQAANAPIYPEVEITYQGKQIKAPWEKAKTWAQQGYDYSQRLAQFNQQKQEHDQKIAQYETQKKEFDQKYSDYETINKLAAQNPEWWQYVQDQARARITGQQPNQTQPNVGMTPEMRAYMEQQLAPVMEFKTKFEEQQHAALQKSWDEKVDQAVNDVKKSYPSIDFDTPDESGLSLEKRVIKHGIDNNITIFRAAFRDYNFDNLMKLKAEEKLQEQTKVTQNKSRLGLIGKSPTPTTGKNQAIDFKNSSYDDLIKLAKKDYGIA